MRLIPKFVATSPPLFLPSSPVMLTSTFSQIKVRDISKAQVNILPAEYATWSEARAELMKEAKRYALFCSDLDACSLYSVDWLVSTGH